jgi:hypothetical protein
VPVITKCSEPFDEANMKVTGEQIDAEIVKFLNPEQGAEKVPEDDAKDGDKKKKRAR